MKKLKLIASAVALAAAATQANAALYDPSSSFNVATIFGTFPFTVLSGQYDDVTGAGFWNVDSDLTVLGAGIINFDQTFTINSATGVGTFFAPTNCIGQPVACSGLGGNFYGAVVGSPTPIGAGLNTWNVTTGMGVIAFHPTLAAVPVPAAAWLFSSAILGLAGLGRRRRMI